jgi:hypothetical protein
MPNRTLRRPIMFKRVPACIMVLTLVFLLNIPAVAANIAPLSPCSNPGLPECPAEKTAQPVQFISGGRVLDFSRKGIIMASAANMLKIDFSQANPVDPEGDNPLQTMDGSAPPFNKMTYNNLWDGVTLVYTAAKGSILKSTYYLESITNVNNIHLSYNRPVSLDENGNLVVTYDNGSLTESRPDAWQEIEGDKIPVPASFFLYSNKDVGFSLGDCNPALPVIIDPVTTWHTFLGGDGLDQCKGIGIDGDGNVYVAGYSSATWGNPLTLHHGDYDIFVAKLDSSGNLTWNTFLGTNRTDICNALAVESSGFVYLCGHSYANWGNPVQAHSAGNNTDAFAAKLNSSGSLVWNTFLGGTGDDQGQALAIDGSSNVYLSGCSTSTWGNPRLAKSVGTDAFAARLDSSGTLQWNTFLGGTLDDQGKAIALDSSGNVFIGGICTGTWGNPVLGHSGDYDAFAAKLNDNGDLLWNTFLGAANTDICYGLAIDGSGNVYAAGYSTSTWGAPLNSKHNGMDAFVAKLNNLDGSLTWNTFLGGDAWDEVQGITIDSSDYIYLCGSSYAAWGSPVQAHSPGYNNEAFAAKMDSDGSLIWNNFLGGPTDDEGRKLALDDSSNIYVGGISAGTWGIPVRAYTSANDVFAARLDSTGCFQFPAPEINLKQNTTGIPSGGDFQYGSQTVKTNGDTVFTIENTGDAALTFTTPLSIGGTDAGQFSVHEQPVSPVAAGKSTTFTIRFRPTSTGAKSASVSIANNDSDEGAYILGLTGTGLPIPVTVTGVKADNKVYDGNTAAAIDTAEASLDGVISGDNVTLNVGLASGAFDNKKAGNDKDVTISGLTLEGADAPIYSLTQPVTTAGITLLTITVTGITAQDKDYDGNTSAVPDTGSAALVGVISGDDVMLNSASAEGTFSDKNPGLDKTVYISGLFLEGTDAGNYSLTQPTTKADILVAVINLAGNDIRIPSGDNVPSKADSTVFGSIALLDGTSVQTFTITNTGNKVLTLTGSPRVAVSGPDAADFTVIHQPESPLPPFNGSTTFSVAFDPQDEGLRNATLIIASNDLSAGVFSFKIQGTGLRQAVGGSVYGINKASVLAPWLGLAALILLAAGARLLIKHKSRLG